MGLSSSGLRGARKPYLVDVGFMQGLCRGFPKIVPPKSRNP